MKRFERRGLPVSTWHEQRVEAVIEKFKDIREDLDREQKFMGKQWSKRGRISSGCRLTVGMVGDPRQGATLLDASTVLEAKDRARQSGNDVPEPVPTLLRYTATLAYPKLTQETPKLTSFD